MAQRVFDIEKTADLDSLFSILSPDIEKIEKTQDGCKLWGKRGYEYCHFINIKWGYSKSVHRPADKTKWIGCLCRFWCGNKEASVIGILQCFDKGCFYRHADRARYCQCEPVKKEEIKFVEDEEK